MKQSIEAIYVHAWHYLDDDCQEYCDADDNPDGWCAYERTVTDDGGIFETALERDFPTLDAALTWAEGRAALHNCPVQVY